MRVLIVEDEPPIAGYIEKITRNILREKLSSVCQVHNRKKASEYMISNSVDLCLLDLNLNGEDGFELLRQAMAGSFQTIIISASVNRAIEAFEYGVLDYIPKPFTEERLKLGFHRYFSHSPLSGGAVKYLSFRKNRQHYILRVEDIRYFRAAGVYVEAHLKDGSVEILEKKMDDLEILLPKGFLRCHRSYVVDVTAIESYCHCGGGNYQMKLKNGEFIPISRLKYKKLHKLMN